MLKTKLSILLFNIFFLISCNSALNQSLTEGSLKFSVHHIEGDKNGFIFSNLLKQQLRVNDFYDPLSTNVIYVTTSNETKYLVTSVTKTSTRNAVYSNVSMEIGTSSNRLPISINFTCSKMEETYSADQMYMLAASNANLSNIEAENDIIILNSENIIDMMIDDLIFYRQNDCYLSKKLTNISLPENEQLEKNLSEKGKLLKEIKNELNAGE
ncbi:MAG: hypothetical protein CMI90_02990 [Pelagibacteraceae bacterium]|nr:hypothetical protein [Pelagibacteraceae bacterium]|tara:strand:+ start:5342 stop:5977 length:636 start_codon:yes stop_codon:yes gene_type:complete